DLKDLNNAVYEEKTSQGHTQVYVVSDLGASFGAWGLTVHHNKTKGNLENYRRTKFLKNIGPEFVDFEVPHRPSFWVFISMPEYFRRVHLEWIGQHVPRLDAKWMGDVLAQLSPDQIRDAFRAGGYSTEEVDGFTAIVEQRIAELTRL